MKRLITLLLAVVFSSSAFAINIYRLKVGDSLYLEGVLSDELVYTLNSIRVLS